MAGGRGKLTDAEFAAAMARLGPFEPNPFVAVAVSGGADSLALTVLTQAWARDQGGRAIGLVVDHGLRPESTDEARETARRLAERGLAVRILPLTGLERGPGLAERARASRYAALIAACENEGALHLLIGHHAADQAETVAHRALRGSSSAGLAGMAALVELASVRLLRPLLCVSPCRLRATLREIGLAWVEDPSNRDPLALRSRLRAGLLRHLEAGAAIAAIADAAVIAGHARAETEARVADTLGRHVTLRPEGFAVLPAGRLPAAAMAALVQAISGAPYPPAPDAVAELAAAPGPATLAGVRLLPAGRLGPGLMMVREIAAMAPPVPAAPGAVWDGRFRVGRGAALPPETTLGALDADAALLRGWSRLPSVVLRTLPALRAREMLVAVPHLLYPDAATCARARLSFAPPRPAAGAPFATASVVSPSWLAWN